MILHFIPVLTLCVLHSLAEERLPTDVIPQHYDLDIHLNTETRSFTGKVCIKILCESITKTIQLHGKREHIVIEGDPVLSSVADSQSPKVLGMTYNSDNDILTISTSGLEYKQEYSLCIWFKGEISEERGYVIWTDPSQSYIIATNFQRQSAFPCFDEPNLRATFSIALTISSKEYSYSNTEIETHLKHDDPPTITNSHKQTPRLPPSQIAFVVTDIDLNNECLKYPSQWTPCFQSIGPVRVVDKVIATRKDYTYTYKHPCNGMTPKYRSLGPDAALPNVNFIVIPPSYHTKPAGMTHRMEVVENLVSFNWGLVLIRENDIKNFFKVSLNMYNVYHRMTSQYFGGMVSPDGWDSNWLFTALAEYVAYIQMPRQPFLKTPPSYMLNQPRTELDLKLIQGIDRFENQIVIGHDKGLYLLRMIRSVLGDELFIKAIGNFIKKYKFQSAGPDKLWQILDELPLKKGSFLPTDSTWSSIMKTWTERSGYPLVTVTATGECLSHCFIQGGAVFKVAQERFISSYEKKMPKQFTKDVPLDHDDAVCWSGPISHTVLSQGWINWKPRVQWDWLGCKEIVIETKAGKNDLVLFNPSFEFLYRVKYDEQTWEKIVSALQTRRKSIDEILRAQLVHDALSVAWAGYQDYGYVFKLQPYLRKEDSDIVWEVFLMGAYNLREILETSPETYASFQVFLNPTICKTFYKKFYGTTHPYYKTFDRMNTVAIPDQVTFLFHSWTCNVARNEYCREKAIIKFDEIMKNGHMSPHITQNKFDINSLSSTLICTVLSEQKQYDEKWLKKINFILEALKRETISYKRDAYLRNLRCISDKDTILSLLELMNSPTDDKLTKEDKQIGFQDLAQGIDSFAPTLEYFYRNIDKIMLYHEKDEALAMIVNAFFKKISPIQVSEMEAFVKNNPKLSQKEKVVKAVEQGKAAASRRHLWLANNDAKIRSLLARKYSSEDSCVKSDLL